MDLCTTSIRRITGIAEKRARLLGRLGIKTIYDLLSWFPRAYADRSAITPIASIADGDTATIIATVTRKRKKRGFRGRGGRTEATLRDETGEVDVVWFNQPYIAKSLAHGDRLVLSGKFGIYKDRLQLASPEFEPLEDDGGKDDLLAVGRIAPVYRLCEGVWQNLVRRAVKFALDSFDLKGLEILAPALLGKKKLLSIEDALREVHFPSSMARAAEARTKLCYDELLLLQTGLLHQRHTLALQGNSKRIRLAGRDEAAILGAFPFALTRAQRRVIGEIKADLASPAPMNRLLQGDVGSGKTVVALFAMMAVARAKLQSALMAPTEVLAEQHYITLRQYVDGTGLRVGILTGRVRGAQRRRECEKLAAGDTDIVVGTHALIQAKVAFRRLGLAVIDEQHKFGVMQRSRLRTKGLNPGVLVMTATPIPRTLTLTVYGNLDVSVLDELPASRKSVRSETFGERKRASVYAAVKKELANGRQAFIICPLVEESETIAAAAAVEKHAEVTRAFTGYRVGLLHGRLKKEEKEAVMQAFRAREFDLLVATVVIEVGIDVPNATVMIVENSERFGLAQLHQIRGRIGRGEFPSTCYFHAGAKTRLARERLKCVLETTDGFRISEKDLELRGYGEFFGTKQYGLPELRIADLARDYSVLVEARGDAEAILAADPALEHETNRRLRERVAMLFGRRLGLARIG